MTFPSSSSFILCDCGLPDAGCADYIPQQWNQVHSAPVTYSYADPRGEKAESIKIVIVGAPGVNCRSRVQHTATSSCCWVKWSKWEKKIP